jgi:tetratricopeptide (TPR) repeat protein
VFEGMEGIAVVPCGQSYLVVPKSGERPVCAADGRRFPRRLRLRGVFTSVPLDENTQNLLSTYVMGFYWRGRGLASKGRASEALSRFREALSWPRYRGTDLAAIHRATGGCLEAVGDLNGALREYEDGLLCAPSSPALRKALESVRARL